MSYNIDSVDTKVVNATIDLGELAKLRASLSENEWIPEGNFLDDLVADDPYSASSVATLKNLDWYGDGSGRTYEDVLIKKICPLIHGHIEAVFTWEGGDSFSGLIVKDGKVTECDVEQKLVPKK